MASAMLDGAKLSAQGQASVTTATSQGAALPSGRQPRPRHQYTAPDLWLLWGWPACATILVHGLALGLLALAWAPQVPDSIPAPSSVSLTLMSATLLASPVPSAMPVPEPAPAPGAQPMIDPAPTTEPAVDLAPPEPVIDQAALARERRAQESLRELELQRQTERERHQAALHRQQQAERDQRRQRELQHQQQEQEQAERAQQQESLATQHQQTRSVPQQPTQTAQQIIQYQPLSKVAPDYPRRALERGVEGDCTVQYDVKADGRVSKPSILSCDDAIFERPSLRAAAGFRYEPRRVNGQAVSVPGVRNTFRYRIESK